MMFIVFDYILFIVYLLMLLSFCSYKIGSSLSAFNSNLVFLAYISYIYSKVVADGITSWFLAEEEIFLILHFFSHFSHFTFLQPFLILHLYLEERGQEFMFIISRLEMVSYKEKKKKKKEFSWSKIDFFLELFFPPLAASVANGSPQPRIKSKLQMQFIPQLWQRYIVLEIEPMPHSDLRHCSQILNPPHHSGNSEF